MDKLDQIITNFMGNFRNVYREAKKTRILGDSEALLAGPFCRPNNFSMGLHGQQSCGLVPMDQSPQEGGGLNDQSLDSSRNDGERVF